MTISCHNCRAAVKGGVVSTLQVVGGINSIRVLKDWKKHRIVLRVVLQADVSVS